ncbi:DUF2809 domain-containing protein [Hymenobacter sp. HSC-4F20]|uniref:ribosomal maturation YjgA family protein n=1 Tax=Hymenobacter sp. HSC-4F20 TaxID=2864135 RepID=UPI001C73BE2A|nr:DUF2809 domain-containing protein [Hymenobacter sp. HSC-4F20]MBX0290588.1 DUF2809 domain-containing protein [Hymenobacter sp. HSC-4F20]
MWRFHRSYFLSFLLLLLVEILIAALAHDRWLRPYGGDVLVVVLLYCFLGSFWQAAPWRGAGAVLLFALVIEGLQAVHFIHWLGLEQSLLANLILGSGFAWADVLAYGIGTGLVLWVERKKLSRREKQPGLVK